MDIDNHHGQGHSLIPNFKEPYNFWSFKTQGSLNDLRKVQ